MYEIWMMLNIAWELVLEAWPWLLAAGLVWLLLARRAWRRAGRHGWRAALPAALLVAIAVAVLVFFAMPGLIHSGMAELRYWVDWATLLGIAAGSGALAFAFAWPLLARRRSPGSRLT